MKKTKLKPHPLRIIRKSRGMTLENLSKAAFVAVRTITGIESGEITTPRYATRRRLLISLGLEMSSHREVFEKNYKPNQCSLCGSKI